LPCPPSLVARAFPFRHLAPDHVCLLQKSLYRLKQARCACHQRFATFIRTLGFVASVSNSSLFVYKEGITVAYLLLHVNDIVLTASSTTLLQQITKRLHPEFAMTDLGDLHHFLGFLSLAKLLASFYLSDSTLWTSYSVPV
jgi:hypothetical protein